MRLSRAAILTSKDRLESNELLSQQILFQSGQLKRYGSGIYGKHHFLTRIQLKIENIIREVLDEYDCVEISLPLLQPEEIWKKSGRFDSYTCSGEMFYYQTSTGGFCLAPTAEEAMIEFARNNLKSYKDLPVNLYQIGPKFRNEIRARGGLLRSKDFTMMDAYSFHSSEESLKQEYEKMKKAYLEIFKRLGLNVIPVGALNGEMGGNFSEEFMVLADGGEDTILVNEDYSLAFNDEILNSDDASSYLKKFGIEDISMLTEKHCIEVGHIFQLGQRYSLSMNATFRNAENQDIPYFMGCYGIGTSRTLAAIAEANCDEEGLLWPEAIAPYQIMIVYTHSNKDFAFDVYNDFLDSHINVIIDDRKKVSFGAKIKDWKLFGIPYLLIIGDKASRDYLEVENRYNGAKITCSELSLLNFLS